MLKLAPLIAALLIALVPATAGAATVTKSGATITLTGTASDESVLVLQDASSSPANYIFTNTTASGGGCVAFTDGGFHDGARCPAAGVTVIIGNMGDGADFAGRELFFFALCGFPPFFPPCPPPLFAVDIPLTIDGGAGNDSFFDGDGADDLSGGAGDDSMLSFAGADTLHGGDGDDTLTGGSGDNILFGDDGRDNLSGSTGNDEFNGGDGFDQVTYAGIQQAVKVTLDDVANDGRIDISETDNAHKDVEAIHGGVGADQLTGNELDNTLTGGQGVDTLDAGAGFDAYYGEEDGANVLARDGNSERVDCGDGAGDLAQIDDFDATSGCETIQSSPELQGDLDKDGFAAPADCNDKDADIKPGATDTPDNGVDEDCSGADATNTDVDADGFKPPTDCDDKNAAIKPGATEVFGNTVDEDCSGKADPLQNIDAFIQTAFVTGNRTQVDRLRVRNLTAGTSVVVTCKGGKKKGCAVSSREFGIAADKKTLDLRKPLKLKKVSSGASVEVRILRTDSIGEITTLKFRKGKVPSQSSTCIRPGATKTSKCP